MWCNPMWCWPCYLSQHRWLLHLHVQSRLPGKWHQLQRWISNYFEKAQLFCSSSANKCVHLRGILREGPCEEDNTVACKAFSSHVSPFLPSLMCGSKAKSHHCLDDKRNNHLCRFPSAYSVYYPLREVQSRDKQLVHSVSLQTDVSLWSSNYFTSIEFYILNTAEHESEHESEHYLANCTESHPERSCAHRSNIL